MATTYMTRQQQAVLAGVRRYTDRGVTAAALTQALGRQGQSVGLTTVYRQLERLVQRGLVHKIVTDEGTYYQYCDAHGDADCFLLKCERCGCVTHADCSHLGELYRHLAAAHGFTVDPRRTLFYGVCDACREAGAL